MTYSNSYKGPEKAKASISFASLNDELVLVFVDLENSCGGSEYVVNFHREVRKAISMLSDPKKTRVIFSTGPRALELAPNLLWEWGSARYIFGHGIDGADNSLIRAMISEPSIRRANRVILVSGDHIFADLIEKLTRAGVHTTVVAQPAALSSKLRLAANQVAYLPTFGASIKNRSNKAAV